MQRNLFIVSLFVILTLFIGCKQKVTNEAYDDTIIDYHFNLKSLPYGELHHQYPNLTGSYNYLPTDSNGVPLYIRNGISHYHPVLIANRCLDLISDYRISGDNKYLQRAIISAETLRSHALRYEQGLYFPYTFDYDAMEKPGYHLSQPWFSGMAQGMLLSIYCRLYYLTNDPLYQEVADSVLTSLKDYTSPYSTVFISTDDGVGLGAGYFWLDEYPFPEHLYVINGSIIGSMGFYDHWWVFGDRYSKTMMSRELSSIKDHILLYRNPNNISYYEIRFNTCNPNYQAVHVSLLNDCSRISGDPFFQAVSDLLRSDYSLTPNQESTVHIPDFADYSYNQVVK